MNNKIGRGLSSLLGDKDLSILKGGASDKYKNIALENIVVNPNQPRKKFDEHKLNELATSIKEFGVLQPIIVKKIADNKFEIISGERRYKASLIVGLLSIPAIIQNYDDQKAYSASVLENIQRENLNIVEEAKAYNELITHYGYTQQTLATKLGKSRSHITNTLRLLNLPEKILNYLIDGKIEMGHARALINFDNAEEYIDYIVDNSLSVRDVEKLVKGEISVDNTKIESKVLKNQFKTILKEKSSDFTNKFGLKCKIDFNAHKNKGTISFEYDSIEDLDNILNNLGK